MDQKRSVHRKTGKNNAEEVGKSKEGRRTQIDEGNNWIVDQPHAGS
jgi:hypothetical protein